MSTLQTGTILIAEPFLKDPHFMRTALLLCEHKEEGSFGFVLNRQTENWLCDLIDEAEGLVIPVYFGGPVQPDTIHFLHTSPALIPDAIEIDDGIFWGGNFHTAIKLLKNGQVKTDEIRFFLGYSGWSQGQLDQEMQEGSWLTTQSNRRIIFDTPTQMIWQEAIRQLGGQYEMMINFPTDPQLN